jgi:hypothetical protein
MSLTFKPAKREQVRLRMALYGPSGSGKTMTALAVATGLGDRVAVIDTEHASSARYADHFHFDVLDLRRQRPEDYIEALQAAAKHGYPVVVIDSISHAWQELLERVDRTAAQKFQGNTWSAWSQATPVQRKLIEAILSYPGHVIATMRSRTTWRVAETRDGRARPEKIGLAPEQGKGIEYEFDVLGQLDGEHRLTVEKDRTGRFQGAVIDRPTVSFGVELREWLEQGAKPQDPPPATPASEEPERETEPPARPEEPYPAETRWMEYRDQFIRENNARWRFECDANGVDSCAEAREEPTELLNPLRVDNAIATLAVEHHLLDEKWLLGPAKPDGKRSRNQARTFKACCYLFDREREWVERKLREYRDRKLAEARTAAGLTADPTVQPWNDAAAPSAES